VTLLLSLLPPISIPLVLMTTLSAYQAWICPIMSLLVAPRMAFPYYSKPDGELAKSFNVIKISQAGDSYNTDQTGSYDRSDQSSSDQPPEPTG